MSSDDKWNIITSASKTNKRIIRKSVRKCICICWTITSGWVNRSVNPNIIFIIQIRRIQIEFILLH